MTKSALVCNPVLAMAQNAKNLYSRDFPENEANLPNTHLKDPYGTQSHSNGGKVSYISRNSKASLA